MRGGVAVSFDEIVPDARTRTPRHVWSLKFPIRDAAGVVVGLGGVSLDVTDRERATRELAAARELFERMFTSALVGMLVSRVHDDGTTEVIQCNPAFARMLGRDAARTARRRRSGIVHPDDLPERARHARRRPRRPPASAEMRFKHRDGHDIHALAGASLTHGADGERLILLQAVDISERKTLEARLQHLADHDALTGPLQPAALRGGARARGRSARAATGARARCCCSTSTASSRSTTASATRPATHVLVRVSAALRDVLRESDVLARMGGDEFALHPARHRHRREPRSSPRSSSTPCARTGASRATGGTCEVTASIGITAVRAGHALDAAQLLIEADMAMYEAKAAGKDGIAVHEPADGARPPPERAASR